MKVEKIQRHTLKVLSALLAVSLWFYVLNSEPIEIEKKLTINYIMPKDMVMMSFSAREISLKLKGSKAFIRNVFSKNEKINVDLNSYFHTSGKNFRVKFYTSSIEVPFGVEILDVSPKETIVELDQKGMVEVPVKIHYVGEMAKDRKIRELKVTPGTVMISGPIEVLKSVTRIDTAPFNLGMLNKDEGTVNLSIAPVDPRIKLDDDLKLKLNYKTRKNY